MGTKECMHQWFAFSLIKISSAHTDQINLMNIGTGIVSGSVSFIVMENQQLSKKLHKIIIKKIKKHKVYLSFNDNTWKNYLADM